MASKFNINIEGGSGSIIMGDHTQVDITHNSGGGARPGPRQRTNVHVTPTGRAPFPVQPIPEFQGLGVQETEGSVQLRHKIKKGFALIIHNEYFPKREHCEREGSEQDVKAIIKFCDEAGFDVNQTRMKTKNLKACEMYDLCSEVALRSFSRYDAFVCFILSHGSEGGIYGVDDETITVDEIVTNFKTCETLAGKPKLFFIQACQGKNQDSGITVDADSHPVGPPVAPLRLPSGSDVLLAHSTVAGYEAYRNRQDGSWFIETLIEKLEEHAHEMHLMDILTLVNNAIAGRSTAENLKQMPCQTSTLTKFVYFNYPAPLSPS